MTGTLVEATLEATNDYAVCDTVGASVWYRFTAPATRDVVLLLDAAGDMDANVTLFKQVRSQLSAVDCGDTDAQGPLTMAEGSLAAGATYAVRVATRWGSTADTFQLRVLVPTPPPSPPGRPLPSTGVKNQVNRLLNQADAYWTSMRAGRTMRLMREDGTVLGGGNLITRLIPRGTYYVAVTGSGAYTLRLSLRTITHAGLLVDGRRVATIGPGERARLRLRVRPAVSGPSVITVERLDPIDGWQFLRSFHPAVRAGAARLWFKPPTFGRYRAYASYLGTRNAAPSSTKRAWVLVQQPLGG